MKKKPYTGQSEHDWHEDEGCCPSCDDEIESAEWQEWMEEMLYAEQEEEEDEDQP